MDEDLASRMLEVMWTLTVNDISYDTMNRIARRIHRLPPRERGTAVRVAEIITDELGAEKARDYVGKALANGLISHREHEEMRAAIALALPREKVPAPVVPLGRELIETQQRVQREFDTLSETARQTLQSPMRSLDEDVRRLRRAWGL